MGDHSPRDPSRRDFLSKSSRALVAAVTCGAAAGGVRMAYPNVFDTSVRRFCLGPTADFKLGSLTWFGREGLFLLHAKEGFAALSSRCTHLGCIVRHTSEGFRCPCHGARFDHSGEVLSGPARRPLPWYRVWLGDDDRIWVDCGKEVPAGAFADLRRHVD
jgi:nitrite reductase/ring-hydroxylating ferredoxin subunit